ncbi:MAG: PAS domain S-box protein [Deltaproteobacteria bacterium]|nr:MAG: PAS domain S-box protein [Deltaproteobacteria bacterium]
MKQSKSPRHGSDKGSGKKKDVSDIRQSEPAKAAARGSESHYRTIVEAFDGLIYICSSDYRIEFMNPRLIERTGYDGTGEFCYQVLHDRNSICPWCVNDRVFQGETVRWEVQSPKDNRWYYVVNTPIYHCDDRVSKQAVIQDITEFKQTEEALRKARQELERRVEERTVHLLQTNEQLLREVEARQQIEDRLKESEELFLAFMQHLPGGAVIRDLQGSYLFANKAWEKAFAKKWQGKTLEEIWSADTARQMRELDQKVIATGEPVETEITLQQKDGPHTWLINYFPILGQDGKVVLVGSGGVDVTNRKKAEEALIESENRFRQLVENAADAFFVHDKGKIIEVNQQACNSLGYAREELLKMNVTDLEAAISAEDLQKSWEQPKSPVTIRGVHRRKDGSTFPVEVHAADIIYGGRHLRLALVRDITERLDAEEALKQSDIKYRTLVEAAPSGISIIGRDGRYKYLNPKFEELFGYALADIPTGRDWFSKAFPDASYREIVVSDWKEEFKKPQVGEVKPRTFRVLCKDGSSKEVNFRAVALAAGDFLLFYEDISKRVQAEEALRQSEGNYRLLVAQIPAVVFKGYADGTVDFFDRKIEFLTGYKKEDFDSGRLKWTDLILPEDAPGAREALLKALKGDCSYAREYRIRKRDGGILWIQGRGQIFCNAAGRIEYISGVFFDISERKEVEEALRQSEEKYRLLVDQIPAVVFQSYTDWSLDCLGRKIESLTGYAKEDFDARRLKWCDLIPAEEMDYVKQTFVDALKTSHKSYVREHRIRKKSGEYAWVQCRGQIFLDDRDKVAYVSGVTFDITQRKQAEKALEESERLYRLLAENVSDVIWTADLNLQLTYISPSVKFLRGFSPEEVKAQSMDEILTPASLELAWKTFASGMALERSAPDPGRSWTLELEQLRNDGSTIWTEVRSFFLRDEQGQPVGILGITRDISKRKEAELKLRRREAILEAVSIAAKKFLQSESWAKDIQDILRRLGKAAHVSRAYIFENQVNDAGEMLTSQRYEWAAPGIEPQLNNPQLRDFSWRAEGFGRWEEELSQGRMIVGHVRDFPRCEQEFLGSQEIKSIVVMPIFVGQYWWGMIGFDAIKEERQWSAAELEALKAAASILGTAIQREQGEKALRRTGEKLRLLTAELIHAQEKERKRLAAELHDELGHSLLALKLSIRSLEKELTPGQISLKKNVNRILQSIGETIEGVRRLYHDLSPGDLEDLGLTIALGNMVEDFKELHPKIKWRVDLDNLDGLFDVPASTVIYRVMQEALTNIGKHAQATKVSVGAKRKSEEISIIIEDNGRGFDSTQVLNAKRTLGLLAMEERIKILGGSFTLWSQKKRGTRISFTVPFPALEA